MMTSLLLLSLFYLAFPLLCFLSSCPFFTSASPYNPAAAGPLTVHLVCHSHDDVGWQITVDEYYDREVHNILDTVTAALAANPSRKFMYVEQAFFQRWWRQQTDAGGRALAQKLVASKQLEFVNGGWCMHDEAGTHYVDMIDQTTLGHRYISQQFGVQPTVTWQIDPFGHSATQATLFGPLSGMDGIFFARIDYQDKNRRVTDKELEMVWRSSASLGQAAQSFAGAFAPGFGYGPPSGFCWDRGCRNVPIQNNKSLPGYNLDTFVDAFVKTAQTQSAMTAGVNLMWTMGNDFAWQQADLWYTNLDKLIDGVNADGRVKTQYSTPSIYLAAKHAEGLKWPLKTDDFFPYADGPDAYWTGYFTSRPALKRYVRMTSAFLQVIRHWELFTGSNGSVSQVLWEAQGVAQHHDAVSGTAKQAVTYDYAQRISIGYEAGSAFLGQAVADSITMSGGDKPAFTTCSLLNQSICATTQSGGQVTVFLYNPNARPRTQRITVPWSSQGGVSVSDSEGKTVPSQLQATMPNLARTGDSAAMELQFVATVPGLGFATYFLPSTSISSPSIVSPLLKLADTITRGHNRAPLSLPEQPTIAAAADPTISNDYWTLTFDGTTGLLSSATETKTGTVISLTQTFLYYNSYQQPREQDSGAYIFRPDQVNATAVPVTSTLSNWTVVRGAVVSEVRQVFGTWLTQIVRLTAGSPVIEFEWTAGHLPVADGQGKELISRFAASSIASNATWYTDSNGREFQQRVRNYRPTWQWNPTEITAGNYYPCNALAWIADKTTGMAVLNDRSQGCSSLQDGQLEFMIHRRLLHDDGRGVGEPLNEPGTDGQGLTVTGTHYLLLTRTAELVAAARTLAAQVFAPVQPLFAPLTGSVSDYIKTHLTVASAMPSKTSLPVNVDLLTAQVSDIQQGVLLLRLAHQFGVGENPTLSQPVTVDLGALFNVPVKSVVELTLTANQALGSHKTYDWQLKSGVEGEKDQSSSLFDAHVFEIGAANFNVTIKPAEIRTFNVTLNIQSLSQQLKRGWFTAL